MKHHAWIAAASAAWLAMAACGARSELDLGPARAAAEGGGGVGGGPGGGGSGGDGGQGGSGGAPMPPECVVFGAEATPAPLDMFIMMDQSGSMTQLTQGAGQKWWAVREALRAFFDDPDSAGIGVAIGFFPIIDDNVPTLCDDDSDCGGGPDMCSEVWQCMPGSGNRSCDADEDCDGSDTCEPRGYCQNAPNPESSACFSTLNIDCPSGQGPCLPYGSCDNRFTCTSESYETPVVGVDVLPGVGPAVISAIHAHPKQGGTPTLPALTGAVDAATTHLDSTPGHKAVVVLATDGLPTVCDPALKDTNDTQAIANLAAVAADGVARGIQTFVIGVFSPDEQMEVQGNLDSIAFAGGTESAFVATTTSTVVEQFLDALRQVRLAGVCEFGFAVDESNGPVAYDQIWAKITDLQSSQETWVQWVESEQACDPMYGGFYYDQPIDGPIKPSVLTLCPASCQVLGNAADKKLELFSACEEPPDG